MPRSRPRVTATVEEPVLLVLCGRVSVRLDSTDFGDCDLHRPPLADGVEPACEVGVVLPFHTLDVVIARPRECCDVGDRVFVAAKVALQRAASREPRKVASLRSDSAPWNKNCLCPVVRTS
jgi:hypothetical protein